MTQIKKLGFGVVATALFAVLAMATLVNTAYAATLTTAGDVNVPLATNTATGTNTATTGSIVLTLAATDLDAIGETLILTAPAGFAFTAATSTLSGPATTLAGVGTAVLSGGPPTNVATFTATAANNAAAVMTISFSVVPTAITTASGDIAMSGTGVGAMADVATLTVDSNAGGWVSIAPVASVPGSGATNTTLTAIVGAGTGGGATAQASKQVTLNSTIAGFGTTGSTSTTLFSNASGVVTTTYRGTGTTGTDSITATTPAPNSGVGSVTATLTAAAAGTPTAIAAVNNYASGGAGTTVSNIAPSTTSVTPNYTSPNTGTNVVFRVTDAAGVGAGTGQVIQVTTDKGGLVAYDTACSTTAPKVITVTSTTGTAFGGSSTTGPGRAAVRYCAGTGAANQGAATITATNVTTTMAAATATVTVAGVPATVTTNWTGGALEVTVTDSAGNPVADGTEVTITMAASVGSVAPASRTTVAGKATFAVALTGASGNAIVSVNDTASGTNRLVKSVNVTATTPTTPTGDGSLTTPNFGDGNVGSAVFAGGTIEELSAAVTAAGGTAVWVQGTDGNWYRYNTLATGATAFVNNAFNTQFSGGLSQSAVFVVK